MLVQVAQNEASGGEVQIGLKGVKQLKEGEKSQFGVMFQKLNSEAKGEGKDSKIIDLLTTLGEGKSELLEQGFSTEGEGTSQEKQPLSLFDLLKGKGSKEGKNDLDQLNPKLVKMLENQPDGKTTLKALMVEAKNFLKDQLTKETPNPEEAGKKLPKTLKALIALADKQGLDLKSITLDKMPQSEAKEKALPLLNSVKSSIEQRPMLTSLVLQNTQKERVDTKPQESKKETKVTNLSSLLSSKQNEIKVVSTTVAKMEQQSEHSPMLDQAVHRMVKESAGKEKKGAFDLASLLNKASGGEEKNSAEVTTSSGETTGTEKKTIDTTTQKVEQKIATAKTMISHLSQNIREAIENYKPPFTKLTMKLNPQALGEIDLTLVQRGNSVHVNLSSNATALTLLMQNANDLRAQLAQVGLADTTMNFNHQQQQERDNSQQQEQKGKKRYQGEMEELEEEARLSTIESLDIVIPNYV
jgi:flagellar hook-length control protein FliK